MKRIQKAALLYLLLLGALTWGVAIGRYEVFPFELLREIVHFARGNVAEDTTVTEKLRNDLGFAPERSIREFPPVLTDAYRVVEVEGLRSRREQPRVLLRPDAPRGYRIVFGAFDFEEVFHGALLLDPDGRVVHQWYLSTDHLPLNADPPWRRIMYGVSPLPDGSVVFGMMEEGGGIVRVDWCSRPVWNLDGVYHHTAAAADDGTLWTFEGRHVARQQTLVQVDLASGRVLRKIGTREIVAANPTLTLWGHLRGLGVEDPLHGNDVEALSRRLDDDFPQFEAGALLVSFRTPNLVFVLDPETLEVQWWRMGPWHRQHDPDWNAGGFISVFSNVHVTAGGGNRSAIVAIDPTTFEHRMLVDGRDHDFYSAINGMHQVTDEGTVLVTSSGQGRAFEVNARGEIVFDFVNVYDAEENEALHLADAYFLGPDYFDFGELPDCGG